MRRLRTTHLHPAFAAASAVPAVTLPTLRAACTVICRPRPPLHTPATYPCMVANGSADDNLRLQLSSAARYAPYGGVAHATANRDAHDPELGRDPSQPLPTQQPTVAAPPASEASAEPVDRRLVVAGVALLLALTAGGVAAASGALSPDSLVALAAWFETLGPNAVYLYAGLYFLLELVGVPALPLTLGSGYLFGIVTGTVTVSIASTAAAAASFLIARYGLRDSVMKLASRFPRFRAMDRAIGREGFKFVFLLRLSPLLPFAISNYLYGLTSVDLPAYVAGSWLGMLPGTIAYVSAGAAVGALTDLSAGKSTINPILVVIGVVATVAALTTIGKMATEAIEADDEEVVHS